MTFLETAINSYKLSCLDFIREYTNYIENHVSVIGIGKVQVKSEGIERPFKYLSDVLHWGVVIYDTIDKSVINNYDKSYMSAVKFVDNATKHQKDYSSYDLWEFIRPNPQFKSKVNSVDVDNVNVGFSMTLKFIFQDITGMKVDPKHQNQKDNYMSFLCGKDVNEVISNMEKIIKKHVNLGGDPI